MTGIVVIDICLEEYTITKDRFTLSRAINLCIVGKLVCVIFMRQPIIPVDGLSALRTTLDTTYSWPSLFSTVVPIAQPTMPVSGSITICVISMIELLLSSTPLHDGSFSFAFSSMLK